MFIKKDVTFCVGNRIFNGGEPENYTTMGSFWDGFRVGLSFGDLCIQI